jgi:hypothetical protein
LADRDQPSMANALEFRIEGEIKGAMLHGRRSLKFPDDGRMRVWVNQPATVPRLGVEV